MLVLLFGFQIQTNRCVDLSGTRFTELLHLPEARESIQERLEMKAAVFHEPHNLRTEEKEIGEIGHHELLVKIAACGVCGTDIHIYDGEAKSSPPVVLGHEFAGIVEEVGSGVDGFQKGDRVAIDPNIFCGYCLYCRKGLVQLCENLRAIGVNMDGGFAEYCLVPSVQAYTLPADFPIEWGCFAEPVSCAIRGIERANVQLGDQVVILGAGTIGLTMIQLAKLTGAGKVIVVEPIESKQRIAEEVGADQVIEPHSDIAEIIAEHTEGGADVVIECVGKPEVAELAVSLTKGGGKILFFGLCEKEARISIRPQEIFYKELAIMGSLLNPYTFKKSVTLLAERKINLKPLTIARFPLDDILKAFDHFKNGDSIKTLVIPSS